MSEQLPYATRNALDQKADTTFRQYGPVAALRLQLVAVERSIVECEAVIVERQKVLEASRDDLGKWIRARGHRKANAESIRRALKRLE